ncbi:COP9 signalosome complex subunit 1 [Choanephora cucurbitarum]|uniref:COP9 signalosome complex subunit 1 n=1 Tax=Choanephora cucurbitarum TaxID=101091 RepID=A0A1C7NNK5_9FUNG|nr:COP9 signalosome complex subunit 1 [Choanephora cucurbitarum]
MLESDMSIDQQIPNFDFETYISNYEAKQASPPLSIEAYKMAIQDIKEKTFQTTKYQRAMEALNAELTKQGQPTLPLDQQWLTETRKKSLTVFEQLEAQVKAAKQNFSKEDIRVSQSQLGDYYYKKGDLPAATKAYVRTRDHCTTSQHIIEMCFNTIQVYLDDQNFSHVVQTYITRAESTPNIPDKTNTISKLRCCQAVSLLGASDATSTYRAVAEALMEVSFESANSIHTIMSPNDVAIYGGLCALVSYDRRQLSQVLNNSNFKNFLVLEPSLHELLEAFYQSKYAVCFELLSKYQQSLRLDVYLASHLAKLTQLVREKAMIQYCLPYSMIDMRKMAKAFDVSLEELENELVHLIGKKDKIHARIDSHQKILCTKKQERRVKAFEQSLLAGDEFERSSRALLIRLHLLKANLVVTQDPLSSK